MFYVTGQTVNSKTWWYTLELRVLVFCNFTYSRRLDMHRWSNIVASKYYVLWYSKKRLTV